MTVLDDAYLLVSKVHLGFLSSYYVDKNSLHLYCICHTIVSFCSRCSLCVCCWWSLTFRWWSATYYFFST